MGRRELLRVKLRGHPGVRAISRSTPSQLESSKPMVKTPKSHSGLPPSAIALLINANWLRGRSAKPRPMQHGGRSAPTHLCRCTCCMSMHMHMHMHMCILGAYRGHATGEAMRAM